MAVWMAVFHSVHLCVLVLSLLLSHWISIDEHLYLYLFFYTGFSVYIDDVINCLLLKGACERMLSLLLLALALWYVEQEVLPTLYNSPLMNVRTVLLNYHQTGQ